MREEKLHGRALDPPALGDAVEEPRAVVVHHELEGGVGSIGDGIVKKKIMVNFGGNNWTIIFCPNILFGLLHSCDANSKLLIVRCANSLLGVNM